MDTISESNIHAPARVINFVLIALIAASFVYCYYGVITTLVSFWRSNPVYSHGFLIPLISLYLAWLKRDSLKRLEPSPELFLGSCVFVGSVLVLVVGKVASVMVIQELSLVVSIAGVVLFVLGRDFFRVLLFPIAYLAFMIRFWDSLTVGLQPVLQRFSASMATGLLHLVNVPAYRSESIYIELPNITLKVADVCSGVNYLISVVAMGVLLGYLFLGSWTKKVLLILFAITVALLSNGFRVGLIGFLSYHDMVGSLHGPYHVLQAMFVSIIGFMALFAGVWVLGETTPSRTAKEKTTPAEPQPPGKAVLIVAVISSALLLVAGSYVNLYRVSPVPLEKDLSALSYDIAGWEGADYPSGATDIKTFGADQVVTRSYSGPRGGTLLVHVGYYTEQAQDRELISYRTAFLHEGAEKMVLKGPGGRELEVNRTVINGTEVLFYYKIYGTNAADKYVAKALTAFSGLVSGRTNGAAVMVSSPVGEVSLEKKASFINELDERLAEHFTWDGAD